MTELVQILVSKLSAVVEGRGKEMGTMERKTFETEIKASNDQDLTLEHFVSTEERDRDGDIMRADGMRIVGKPVVLHSHGRGPLGTEPIAKALSIAAGSVGKRKGILAKTQFFPDEIGRRLYQKAKDGYAPNWSVGYIVEKSKDILKDGRMDGREIEKWQLLEYSMVGVPMNPGATGLSGDDAAVEKAWPLEFKICEEMEESDTTRGGCDDKGAGTIWGASCEATNEKTGSVLAMLWDLYRGEQLLEWKSLVEPMTALDGWMRDGQGELPRGAHGLLSEGLEIPEEALKGSEEWAAEEKPFPNEHACRLVGPGGFDRIRRQNDKFGKGVHAIWGIKESKSILQAIRFSSSVFSVDQAKEWVKDHDYKCKIFEPASAKEEGLDTPPDLARLISGFEETLKELTERIGALGKGGAGVQDPALVLNARGEGVNPPDKAKVPRLVFRRGDEEGKKDRREILRSVVRDVLTEELRRQVRKTMGKVD